MNNQNNCLFELKRSVCECITTSCLNINCDDVIECIHEEIDLTKFKKWFQYNENKIKSKTNQTSYFKKSFLNELQNGTFKPKPKEEINEFQVLADVMPTLYKYLETFEVDTSKGFDDETFFVEELQLYIVENKILTIDELNVLNERVMNYITTNESPKLTDYRNTIKKTQSLKDKVNWEEIDKRENERRKDFNETMKMFEQREVANND